MLNLICNCSLCCNKCKCYRIATDVGEVLPSSVTEYKHSHVMVRFWYSICFSSGPPGVGFVSKSLRGALILEIACTFHLFTEQTVPEKLMKSRIHEPKATWTLCAGLMFDFGRLTHVCMLRLSEVGGCLTAARVKHLGYCCVLLNV